MTRPKDLTLESPPVDGDSVPVDSAGGGTRRSLVAELRDATKLRGVAVSATAPGHGEALVYDSIAAAYAPEGAPPSAMAVSGFDDFDTLNGWVIYRNAGGTVEATPSVAPYGLLPGSGVVFLGVSAAANSAAQITKAGAGMALDATVPIVLECYVLPAAGGLANDTEFDWVAGFTSVVAPGASPVEAIMLFATWSAGVRSYRLAFMSGGSESDSVAVTLPALGAGLGRRFRISATTVGATLEHAIDDGAYSVIGTLTGVHVPTPSVYQPSLMAQRGAGAGNRVLCVDFCAWRGRRLAINSGLDGIGTTPVYQQREVLDRRVTANATLDNYTDEVLRVDTASGNLTITLPDPVSKRKFVIVKVNAGANTISLARFGTEKIMNVAATYALPNSNALTYPSWTVYSDGTDWWRVQ